MINKAIEEIELALTQEMSYRVKGYLENTLSILKGIPKVTGEEIYNLLYSGWNYYRGPNAPDPRNIYARSAGIINERIWGE